jgi:hypothetical protein
MTLVTTTVSELPIVLIVTDQPHCTPLTHLLELLENNQFFVQVVSPDQAPATVSQFQASGQEIYRLFLVSGFSRPLAEMASDFQRGLLQSQARLNSWRTTLSWLSQNNIAPISALIGVWTWQADTASHPFIAALNHEARLGNELVEIIQKDLPTTQLLIAWDCLTQIAQAFSAQEDLELPLLFSILSAQARVLLDPQQTWYLQTTEGLFAAIGQQILKPHRQEIIAVRGKAAVSSHWLEQAQIIIERYFAYSPTLLPVGLAEQQLSVTPDIICQTESQILERLDLQLRTLPHGLAQLDTLSHSAATQRQNIQWEPHQVLAGLTSPQITQSLRTSSMTNAKPSTSQLKAAKTAQKAPEPYRLVAVQKPPTPIQRKELTQQSKLPVIESVEKPLNVEAELYQLFGVGRGEKRQERLVVKAKTTKKIVLRTKRQRVVFYLGALLATVGVVAGICAGLFQVSLHLARSEWESGLEKIVANQQLPQTRWSWLGLLSKQTKIYQTFLHDDVISDAQELVKTHELIKSYQTLSQELSGQTGSLLAGVTGQQSNELSDQLTQLQKTLGQLEPIASQLGEKLKNWDKTSLSAETAQNVKQLEKTAQEQEIALTELGQVTSILPNLVGLKSKQTYLVVVQNQQELRPTGGFIQAVGRLSFSQGVLVDHTFQSVYELDNKLASDTKPPDEIKRFLGESRWYLRDSNWSPDFPTSAKQVSWFYQDATGQAVDGVIGITLETVKELLRSTGPLDIPELNEQVTDKNLYDRLEFHAETKTVSVNGQPTDYLSLILNKLMAKLMTLEATKLAEMGGGWLKLLPAQDIQIAMFDDTQPQVWKELGWDGGLVLPHCPSQFITSACLVDSLYQVDSNVGINKVNPYVDKTVIDKIDVGAVSVSHRRTITYRNQAKLDSWPQGQYRVFVKFLLGDKATLDSVAINQVPVVGESLVTYTEQGKTVIGVLVQVPRQKSVTVELAYHQDHALKAPFSYFFFNQKQPGAEESQDVFVSYLPKLKPRLISPQADVQNKLLNFHFDRRQHTALGITFE